ncbi:MAG: L-lactate permease, partial [Enterococcus sp.]|nr:L-lactate permease [Enterococcus sp.]
LHFSVLTICCVFALTHIINFSGQTQTIGRFLLLLDPLLFVSPVLSWISTAVTGSDTSINALFSNLQA